MKKKAIIVHSGGMDSSICLSMALEKYKAGELLSLSFTYNQRHSLELEYAQKICTHFCVDHKILDISCLSQITRNSLTDKNIEIQHHKDQAPNTLVVGRNGLMARIAAIHANSLGAHQIYMGVIEVESANSGYRDCSRSYMDKLQEILKIDLGDDQFEIITPVIKMSKVETMIEANRLGVLEFLLENTLSCYEGIEKFGCGKCPACNLRNQGISEFLKIYPTINFSYKNRF